MTLSTSFAPDRAVTGWFERLAAENPALVAVGEVLAVALHPWVFRIAVAIAVVALWQAGRRRAALTTGLAMAGGSLLVVALKLVIQRPRPTWADPVTSEVGFAMPSSHATNSALGVTLLLGLAWPLLRRRRRSGAAVGLAVVVVGLAMVHRLVLGVHYLSDVLVGAGLGATIGLAAVRWWSR